MKIDVMFKRAGLISFYAANWGIHILPLKEKPWTDGSGWGYFHDWYDGPHHVINLWPFIMLCYSP